MNVRAWRCSVCHAAFLNTDEEHFAALDLGSAIRSYFVHEVECTAKTGQHARVRPWAMWDAEQE